MLSLFDEAGIVPSSDKDKKTALLCDSAAAICSSLSPDYSPDESTSSTGPDLAIRLLLPYAKQGDRVLVATIAGILDRHLPGSDQEAEHLLSICRPLLELKSAHVLDGCTSVVLCRFRFHKGIGEYGDAIHWLLKGVELENLVLPEIELGSCYKALSADCYGTCLQLLKILLVEVQDERTPAVAAAMAEGLKRYESNESSYDIPAAKVLLAVYSMGKDDSDSNVAEQVLACLEERTETSTGIRTTLAPWTFHWRLLRYARVTLIKEQNNRAMQEEATPTSAFGKKGITVLMDRLLYVTEFFNPPADEVAELRETLATALARAFVAENAQKKLVRRSVGADRPAWRRAGKGSDDASAVIRSCDLKRHPVSVQLKVVQDMLDGY